MACANTIVILLICKDAARFVPGILVGSLSSSNQTSSSLLTAMFWCQLRERFAKQIFLAIFKANGGRPQVLVYFWMATGFNDAVITATNISYCCVAKISAEDCGWFCALVGILVGSLSSSSQTPSSLQTAIYWCLLRVRLATKMARNRNPMTIQYPP